MSYEHLKVFAGLNQVSVGLNRFKSHVRQKQVFAGRNPTLLPTRRFLHTERSEGGGGVNFPRKLNIFYIVKKVVYAKDSSQVGL